MHTRELEARLTSIHQIEGIVSALRALAIAHRREAERHLESIRKHETAVAGALAKALARVPGSRVDDTDGDARLLIVVGTAQGFTGAFGDRVVEAALDFGEGGLMVIGSRTAETLRLYDREPVWSADMPARAADVPVLASRVADEVFERISDQPATSVAILAVEPDGPAMPLVRRSLVPFDYGRFEAVTGDPPLTTLAPARLLASLVEEYVFTELCEVLVLGFAAENAARSEAMSRAETNIRRIASDLGRKTNRLRQEELTSEIIELSLGDQPNLIGPR